MAAKRAWRAVTRPAGKYMIYNTIRYYLNIILAIADARYQEAYWDQVYRSELWLAALNELIKDD